MQLLGDSLTVLGSRIGVALDPEARMLSTQFRWDKRLVDITEGRMFLRFGG